METLKSISLKDVEVLKMLNFLKMDFYRLFKQKSTYIILAVAAGIVLMTIGTTRLEQELIASGTMPQSAIDALYAASESSVSVGLNANPSIAWFDKNTVIPMSELAETTIRSGILSVLVVVFAVLFVFAERKNGYIKNLVGKKNFKAKLYLSKMAVVAVYTVFIFAAAYFATWLLGIILLQNPIDYTFSSAAVAAMFGQLLYNIVLGLFTTLLVCLLENTTVPIVVGSLLCTGIFSLVYSLVDKVVYKLSDAKDFMLSSFLPSGQLTRMLISSDSGTIVKGFVVLAVFMVIYVVVTFIIAEKKDVN